MNLKYLSVLACPNCHSQLIERNKAPTLSWLNCEYCQVNIPVIDEFVLFNEADRVENINIDKINKLGKIFKQDKLVYEDYIHLKYTKNILEVYAALQPFNESTRAIYPFLSKLKDSLQPNDIIIETWSRTGWYALLLSALFPEQQVFALWEGNNSVLGYGGYSYWFNPDKKPKNLNIIFVSPHSKLPFKNNIAKLIVAYDILHRRELEFYGDDLLRVSHPDGVILAPHVHLSNSEPKPYFERGGTLRHGNTYSNYYDQLITNTNRQCFVLSEQELFNHQDNTPLKSCPEGSSYNGFLAISRKSWLEESFTNEIEKNQTQHARLIPNPLLEVNPISRSIRLKPQGLGGRIRYYLDRHPCYNEKIRSVLGNKLEIDWIKLLIVAAKDGTVLDHAVRLDWSIVYTQKILNLLQKNELLAVLPLSELAINLQGFYSNQHSLFPNSFINFWQNEIDTSPNMYLLALDGQDLTVSEIHQFMLAISAYYLTKGVHGFNSIAISNELDRTKQIILMMAGWWLSCHIHISKNDQQWIDSHTNLVVADEFWNIIDLYLDTKVDFLPPTHSLQLQRVQPYWYELLYQ